MYRIAVIALALLATACGGSRRRSPDAAPPPSTARASVRDLAGRSVGEAVFEQTPAGVLVRITLSGLAPGTHAMHFHMAGKCDPPFETAGEHLDTRSKAHGFKSPDGPHAGDLPNVNVPSDGTLRDETLARDLTLAALFDADGSALVLHSFADDYQTQPAGSSGDRIACGVVSR